MKSPRKGQKIIWRQVRNKGDWISTKNCFVNKMRRKKHVFMFRAYRKKHARREALESKIGYRYRCRYM